MSLRNGPGEPILTARGVTKRFGATVALSNLDLSIHAGEVLALMGANGAGKSTLVKILSGVDALDSGALTLTGRPYRRASPQAAKRLGIATVHQSIADAVVPSLSIADNLLLDRLCDPASPWRVPPSARRDAARPVAARVDLGAPLDTLSLASQQRITLARALASRPQLLILDEPTASLSAAEAERLYATLAPLRDEGVAILLVSHRLGDLRRVARERRADDARRSTVASPFTRARDPRGRVPRGRGSLAQFAVPGQRAVRIDCGHAEFSDRLLFDWCRACRRLFRLHAMHPETAE